MKTLACSAPPCARIAVARLRHVRRVGTVADHLQAEIGLHRRADVEGAAMEQRPAAMLALDAAQIDADLALQLEVVRLAEIVAQQDVFRRDGGVGLQLEDPVAVVALLAHQRLRGAIDVVVEPVARSVDMRSWRRRPRARRGGRVARAQRALDRRRQAGVGPVAGEEQVGPRGCAPPAAARPAPASRRRWRASP